MALTNGTLSRNASSARGGGIYASANAATTLTNVTLSSNSAITYGGGIYFDLNAYAPALTNVSLSGNSALGSSPAGGGIYMLTGAVLTNTIVANSPSGGNCRGIPSGSSNLSDDNTCFFGGGRDNVNVMLGPLANNGGPTQTHMPAAGSPPIDNGTNSGCPSTDQRGVPRPVNGICDVGAVERQPGDFGFYLNLPLILK